MKVIEQLLEGEDLSTEFKEKAGVIVQAAIDEQVKELSEAAKVELEEANKVQLSEAIEEAKATLSSKASEFLTYTVNEWFSKNQIAIESGLKVQIAESFLSGIRGLAEEHNVEIPEGKENIVEGLESKVETLQSKLDESIAGNVAIKTELSELKKKAILESASKDLTDTQVEKLAGLVESVPFGDGYEAKVKTLVESFFPATAEEKDAPSDNGVESINESKTQEKKEKQSYLDRLTADATK